MTALRPFPRRLRRAVPVSLGLGALAVGLSAGPAAGAVARPRPVLSSADVLPLGAGPLALAGRTVGCPGAEQLVRGTAWTTHRLATGVGLREATVKDRTGTVGLHVLTVDLTRPGLVLEPLLTSVGHRTPLSRLAAGRRRLLAATNTGFFDFYSGAPLGPVLTPGGAVTGSRAAQRVVGFTAANRFQEGTLSVSGTVTGLTASGATVSHPVTALNPPDPVTGLSVYTAAWGSSRVQTWGGATARTVTAGRVTEVDPRSVAVPAHGTLLIARGQRATGWLRRLATGPDPVQVTSTATADTATPFRQAYAVGVSLLTPTGTARTDLPCNQTYPQPARTAVGSAADGRRLILAVATDHPGTRQHGLTNNQMAGLMQQLGAQQAWAFDGSGSSELLARLPSTGRLSLRTYPADGAERPIPVGLGIATR